MQERFDDIITKVNEKYGYYKDSGGVLISCKPISKGFSFYVGSNAIAAVKYTKSKQRLLIKKNLYSKAADKLNSERINEFYELKSEPLYMVSDFLLEDDLSEYIEIAAEQAVVDFKPAKTFACCHLYNECSDAGKCLHPKPIYAKQCWYRDNLENGRVFYGNNKNC